MMGFYSCLDTDKRFFKIISLLKIINEDKITNPAPNNVFNVGEDVFLSIDEKEVKVLND